MIKRVLKSKLVSLGYGAGFIETKMREFPISVDASQYTENELQQKVNVINIDKPCADIPRFYLGISHIFVDKYVIDGKVDSFAKFSMVGSQILICDFKLSEKLCIVGITENVDIYILIYNPAKEYVSRYLGKTYEEIFGEERESEANDYFSALTAGGRVPSLKAKDILYVLMSEYVIDMILIENLNPRIKLYDNAGKFAEVITSYKYKYINRRINRIEFVEKTVEIKLKGSGVKAGNISNDPYMLLSEVNDIPDFSLTKPTYVWLINDIGQEELAIFTASERYNKATYKELMEYKDDPELRAEVEKLSSKFSVDAGYAVSKQYLTSVFKRLNRELIVLPLDYIRKNTQESYEYIEPLRYRFTVIKNRREFENLLYNSIENNLNGRYKYRFVEKLSGIYLTIGNKLNYTDLSGNLIRKQSIADFNINYNAAIIKRETIIDSHSIPQLMGYIYKDVDNIGTDMLPVPSIEVVFYFPELQCIGREPEMYNGTAIDLAKGDGSTSFYEIGQDQNFQTIATKPRDPNEKYVTVRYKNSDEGILKENIIRDVVVGSVYTPEIIPVINDKEGKEWVISNNQIPNVRVSNNNDENVVEVRYVKKMSTVRINYINKQGAELAMPVVKNMQVGESFDMKAVKKFVDKTGTEWNLYQSNPSRLTINENEGANIITLVYDVIKADVFISFKTRQGVDIKPQEKVSAVAKKEYSPEIPQELVDANGLLWQFGTDSKSVIIVSETELNTIELYYDEKKTRVVTTYIDDAGVKVKDDVVDIVQIGKGFVPKYEHDYIDIYGKWWRLLGVDKQQMRVSNIPEENIITVTYEKTCSTIMVSMVNENGDRIRDDITEKVQIGTTYTPATINEIEDINGLMWTCVDKSKSIVISESEVQNRISYTYEPLIVDVCFLYVDDEGNEIIPSKVMKTQAGTVVQPEVIKSLTSQDQKGWVLSPNNKNSFKIKKNKEENIFKINYDKKLIDINLIFKNVRGEVIKEPIVAKAQIGGNYKATDYEKVTATNGERWGLLRSEPQTMFVRENSTFTLIYDEIKAKVIVKCVNIKDNVSVIDDQIITTKLGGAFVPNIVHNLFDKDKLRWVYVGEPAMSIITKENEQENIITLKYEPDLAKVTLKYENNFGQLVHQDVVKEEQIGKTVVIKEYEKIIEDNGMGWAITKISANSIIVSENDDDNIVTSYYEPLMADVITRYIDNDGKELSVQKREQVQVGMSFAATIVPNVTDVSGKVWEYSKIKVEDIKVIDGDNKVNIKYVPMIGSVTNVFIDVDSEKIIADKVEEIQVGSIYTSNVTKRVIDEEGKYWIFKKISKESIKVTTNPDDNIINHTYDKELITVVTEFKTNKGNKLKETKIQKLQIGSKYIIEPEKILLDSKKLAWILNEKNVLEVTISPEADKNTFEVIYDEYMVNVYDRFINEENPDEELIEAVVSRQQVGSVYTVKVQDVIIDPEGRHWIQATSGDSSIFNNKYRVEPITVVEDEKKNNTYVKYKPKLVNAIIMYVDSLGNPIKPQENKKLQIGSKFHEDIPKKVIDRLGNRWSFNSKAKVDVTISEKPEENKIALAYEEAKGIITFLYLDPSGAKIQEDTTQLAQIGSHYTPQFESIITDKDGCVWEYSERDRESLEVSDEDDSNFVKLTYIPLDIEVLVNYIDLWDNEISPVQKIKAQLGSKFKLELNKDFTNEDGLLYRLKSITPEVVEIKEIPIGAEKTPNEFTAKFEPVNSNVIIKYNDMDGNTIRDDEKINLQVGSKYTPEPANFIKDSKGNEWELVNAKKDIITVFNNENENVLIYSYDVAKADVIVRYINVDGIVIKEEIHIPMQVGSDYVPSPDEFLLDSDSKKWKLIEVKPVNLKVGSINNIVTATYQEAKARVSLNFVDEEGNSIKAAETQQAQIGSKFIPKITNKVIYNANEIWRIVKTEPYQIVVSENASENLIKLIYTNKAKEEEAEDEKEEVLVNPFANTINEEEKEALKRQENKNLFDATLDEIIGSSDSAVKLEIKEEEPKEKEEYDFKDPFLKNLAKAMQLTIKEKRTIDSLNDLNAQIIDELRKSNAAYNQGAATYDYKEAEQLIVKEKDTIRENLDTLIAKDKTGARLLSIFEHITASEGDDVIFGRLQQRKAIIITDYFLDKPIGDIDKALYICEKGKNQKGIELLEKKINQKLIKDVEQAIVLKTSLYYEKLMLENYYRVRSLPADSFFTDEKQRQSFEANVIEMVYSNLIRQISNHLGRDNMTLAQRNECDASILLLDQLHLEKLKAKVSEMDGKTKRNLSNILKELDRIK